MGPRETRCGKCGYTLPGADPSGPRPRRPPAAVDDEAGFSHKPPEGPGTGIKIRRDAGPVSRPDREAARARPHDPDDLMSAEGGVTPPGAAPPIAQAGVPASEARPHQAYEPPGPGTPLAKPTRDSSAWATAALICALLGWCVPFILSPLALVFGLVAYREITKAPGVMAGMGRATAGVVLGGLGTVLWGGLAVYALTADLSGITTFFRQGQLALNMGVMEALPQAQEQFRAGVYADEDGDGRGEYGTAAQLTASIPDLDLSALENGELGWILRIEMPRTPNLAETRWWAFMEPVGEDTGKPWLYIDESSILRQGDNVTGSPTRRQALQWSATSTEVFIERMIEQRQ